MNRSQVADTDDPDGFLEEFTHDLERRGLEVLAGPLLLELPDGSYHVSAEVQRRRDLLGHNRERG